MKRRWMLALAVVAGLALFLGAFQDALAAERTMTIKVPGCI